MSHVEHCRAKAEEFLQRAAHAPSHALRVEFLELSAEWLELARKGAGVEPRRPGPLVDGQAIIPFPATTSEPS